MLQPLEMHKVVIPNRSTTLHIIVEDDVHKTIYVYDTRLTRWQSKLVEKML